jgi:hypothetical protein
MRTIGNRTNLTKTNIVKKQPQSQPSNNNILPLAYGSSVATTPIQVNVSRPQDPLTKFGSDFLTGVTDTANMYNPAYILDDRQRSLQEQGLVDVYIESAIGGNLNPAFDETWRRVNEQPGRVLGEVAANVGIEIATAGAGAAIKGGITGVRAAKTLTKVGLSNTQRSAYLTKINKKAGTAVINRRKGNTFTQTKVRIQEGDFGGYNVIDEGKPFTKRNIITGKTKEVSAEISQTPRNPFTRFDRSISNKIEEKVVGARGKNIQQSSRKVIESDAIQYIGNPSLRQFGLNTGAFFGVAGASGLPAANAILPTLKANQLPIKTAAKLSKTPSTEFAEIATNLLDPTGRRFSQGVTQQSLSSSRAALDSPFSPSALPEPEIIDAAVWPDRNENSRVLTSFSRKIVYNNVPDLNNKKVDPLGLNDLPSSSAVKKFDTKTTVHDDTFGAGDYGVGGQEVDFYQKADAAAAANIQPTSSNITGILLSREDVTRSVYDDVADAVNTYRYARGEAEETGKVGKKITVDGITVADVVAKPKLDEFDIPTGELNYSFVYNEKGLDALMKQRVSFAKTYNNSVLKPIAKNIISRRAGTIKKQKGLKGKNILQKTIYGLMTGAVKGPDINTIQAEILGKVPIKKTGAVISSDVKEGNVQIISEWFEDTFKGKGLAFDRNTGEVVYTKDFGYASNPPNITGIPEDLAKSMIYGIEKKARNVLEEDMDAGAANSIAKIVREITPQNFPDLYERIRKDQLLYALAGAGQGGQKGPEALKLKQNLLAEIANKYGYKITVKQNGQKHVSEFSAGTWNFKETKDPTVLIDRLQGIGQNPFAFNPVVSTSTKKSPRLDALRGGSGLEGFDILQFPRTGSQSPISATPFYTEAQGANVGARINSWLSQNKQIPGVRYVMSGTSEGRSGNIENILKTREIIRDNKALAKELGTYSPDDFKELTASQQGYKKKKNFEGITMEELEAMSVTRDAPLGSSITYTEAVYPGSIIRFNNPKVRRLSEVQKAVKIKIEQGQEILPTLPNLDNLIPRPASVPRGMGAKIDKKVVRANIEARKQQFPTPIPTTNLVLPQTNPSPINVSFIYPRSANKKISKSSALVLSKGSIFSPTKDIPLKKVKGSPPPKKVKTQSPPPPSPWLTGPSNNEQRVLLEKYLGIKVNKKSSNFARATDRQGNVIPRLSELSPEERRMQVALNQASLNKGKNKGNKKKTINLGGGAFSGFDIRF